MHEMQWVSLTGGSSGLASVKGKFQFRVERLDCDRFEVSIQKVRADGSPPDEILFDRAETLEAGVKLCEGFFVGRQYRRRASDKRMVKWVENLDPLPHMNRVMKWGAQGYFTTFEDMQKAERAIASALGGLVTEIQDQYRELKK